MHPLLPEIVRRFPLIGRPRPDCPPIHERVQEVAARLTACADGAGPGPARGASNALNELALFASDWRLKSLAAGLCWEQINVYRNTGRPLTCQETRWLLEPVVNLARLAIRDRDGDQAVGLLEDVHLAVAHRTDLAVGGRILAVSTTNGSPHDHDSLLAFVRILLLTEGIRALALAGRWDDAYRFAVRHYGIEDHLTEGRQVAAIALALSGTMDQARGMIDPISVGQGWEHDVADCLHLMFSQPGTSGAADLLNVVAGRYLQGHPEAGFVPYHARLGVTLALLAQPSDPGLAARVMKHATEAVITSGDGYGARDLSGSIGLPGMITAAQREKLTAIVTASGLNGVSPDDLVIMHLSDVAAEAVKVLSRSLSL